MHVKLGDYHISDVEFVAAFDVDREKVGKDLSEAIFSGQNNTFKFMDVPHMGVTVDRGMTHDGLGKYLSQVIEKAPGPTADVVGHPARSARSTSSSRTSRWAARRPRSGTWSRRSRPASASSTPSRCSSAVSPTGSAASPRRASRSSATTSRARSARRSRHRVLTRLFMDRGVRVDRTYQLNFGGNTDFMNMLERERLESKKISKTNAVTSMLDYELAHGDVHVGPSDYVPWLKDRKYCYIVMEGTTFGDVPLKAELKLEVWDSPNSAGVIIDAIRCLRIGLDRGLKGTLVAPSSYFMKSPPLQLHDDVARERVEAFIRGEDNETLDGDRGVQEGRQGARDRIPDEGYRHQVTQPERRLEAPHRRLESTPPRLVEMAAVIGYRSTSAVLAHRAARDLARRDRRASRSSRYLAWPSKRRSSNLNFGHVLGLPPDHPAGAPDGAARLPGVRHATWWS